MWEWKELFGKQDELREDRSDVGWKTKIGVKD